MTDDPKKNDMTLPPKLNLRKLGVLKSNPETSADQAPSITLKPTPSGEGKEPAQLAPEKPLVNVSPSEKEEPFISKKKTSRISLEPLEPLKAPTVEFMKPEIPSRQPETLVPTPAFGKDVHKTSRISLESVLTLGEKAAEESQAGPKTIRLKRPSEATTISVSSRPSGLEIKDESPGEEALSKTSRLEETLEETVTAPTRRKTIRIKRPTKRPSLETKEETSTEVTEETPAGESVEAASPELVEVARPAAPGVPARELVEVALDKPHPVFISAIAAAILIACIVIYILAAQAFGPNTSLTQLSYGAPDLDLGWPGKISIMR